jgi:hypothetical protein
MGAPIGPPIAAPIGIAPDEGLSDLALELVDAAADHQLHEPPEQQARQDAHDDREDHQELHPEVGHLPPDG